jgi:hypothetical protein
LSTGPESGRLWSAVADTDVVILTAHFPPPAAGRIIRHGPAFRFVPLKLDGGGAA